MALWCYFWCAGLAFNWDTAADFVGYYELGTANSGHSPESEQSRQALPLPIYFSVGVAYGNESLFRTKSR